VTRRRLIRIGYNAAAALVLLVVLRVNAAWAIFAAAALGLFL